MALHRSLTAALALAMALLVAGNASAQRGNERQKATPAEGAVPPADAAPARAARPANPQAADQQRDPPTVTGTVVAYEAGKSITIETRNRNGAKKSEFAIVKEKTKIELPPRQAEIKVGMTLSVWADKENPATAARIGANSPGRGNRRPNNRPANPNPSPRPAGDAPQAEAIKPPPRPARQPVAGLDPLAVAQKIDREIDAALAVAKLPASPRSDDAEFIRRVYLDIAGVIPPAEKVSAFFDSQDSDKRARLIDELLASPDYGLHFADLWCDRINVKDLPIYREPFVDWMAGSLNAGRGWDEIVLDLLTAEGRFNFITRGKRLGTDDPQALFLLLNTEEGQGKGPNPAWLAGESGRLFLGVQIQCAECHDHPFTPSWKQADFWGLAAFFGRLRTENPGQQQGLHWQESPAPASEPVSIAIPATSLKNVGQTIPARLLGLDEQYQPASPELLRHSLARWITAADNPLFAKATANRTWAHFFGRGLVNPVDDLRQDNQPSHPAVLELLAGELRKSQFDLKHLIRCLCLTSAYQRTSQPLPENEDDNTKYSHMAIKTISPGVLYDSLKAATGWPEMKVGLPERRTKLTVISLFTPREVFVDFFRAAQGEEADPLEYEQGIPQALKLMNAAQLNRVAPVAQRLAESGAGRDQIVEQLFVTTLARRSSPAEAQTMAAFLDRRAGESAQQQASAVLWILINSAEFGSNH
ncbi:MAG: DUF1549 and DUF1553 domain-containing protein [Planctomycetaceae bacterium]|nr:DUF1549 and DUF1553 domain-containing protein [Planctomycetaceae bacterium]